MHLDFPQIEIILWSMKWSKYEWRAQDLMKRFWPENYDPRFDKEINDWERGDEFVEFTREQMMDDLFSMIKENLTDEEKNKLLQILI